MISLKLGRLLGPLLRKINLNIFGVAQVRLAVRQEAPGLGDKVLEFLGSRTARARERESQKRLRPERREKIPKNYHILNYIKQKSCLLLMSR
ncbi:MAG: hypothetical protein LBR11_03350 [Deltaproteobacteria bacterium]|nr:hypothetical protein [Deltaproteobacteria bacterium]